MTLPQNPRVPSLGKMRRGCEGVIQQSIVRADSSRHVATCSRFLCPREGHWSITCCSIKSVIISPFFMKLFYAKKRSKGTVSNFHRCWISNENLVRLKWRSWILGSQHRNRLFIRKAMIGWSVKECLPIGEGIRTKLTMAHTDQQLQETCPRSDELLQTEHVTCFASLMMHTLTSGLREQWAFTWEASWWIS